MLKNTIATCFVLCILIGCAATADLIRQLETSEATHILNGPAYPPLSAESVAIYIQKPDFEYAVVGIIEARGMGFTNEARDQELAIQALKREAASIGANGVLIVESTQSIANISNEGSSTERRIKGMAIRRP